MTAIVGPSKSRARSIATRPPEAATSEPVPTVADLASASLSSRLNPTTFVVTSVTFSLNLS